MTKKSTSSLFLIITLLSLISIITSKGAYPIENLVLKLNEENLGMAMQEFKHLTVLFYSSSDPNCKSIIPEFEKAAQILQKENFVLGKIDSDESSEIIRFFNVEAMPSIAIIYRSQPQFYEGEKKIKEIVDWVLEKTKREFNEIKDEKELAEFKKLYDLSMIYYGKDEKVMREIILAERKIDDIPMGKISDEKLIKSHAQSGHEEKEYIILFTKTELQKYYLYNLTSENIIDFYNLYSTPKVIEFSAQTSSVLFSKRLNSLMIFSLREKEDQFSSMKSLLEKLWPKFNKKLKLFVSDINEGMSLRLAEYCGAKEKDVPIAYILEPVSENPIKFRLQGKINEESLLKFISDWENKKLKPFMKSEPEIKKEDNDGEVFNLVGTSYKKDVIDNDKDVVVYFYAPWCEKCQHFYPRYERLARKLKKNNKKLMFAKMDATENDIEFFPVNRYPTIKFYPGNAKDKEPVHISNRLGIVDMLDVIKSKAFHQINDENYDRKKEIEREKIEKEEELLTSDL